jgi:hypothetical protein
MSPKTRDHLTEYKANVVRVPEDILRKLREIMPELKDESDANLVRVALRKFIYDAQQRAKGLEERSTEILLEQGRSAVKTAKEVIEQGKKEFPEFQKQNR